MIREGVQVGWENRVERALLKNDGPKARPASVIRPAIVIVAWTYVALLLGAWVLLRMGGDRWWVSTLVLFGPRWLFAVPLAVLLPTSIWPRRRVFWPLVLGTLILLGPVLGCCVPWHAFPGRASPHIRVLTCNVDEDHVNKDSLANLIRTTQADVVALQETHFENLFTLPPDWTVRDSVANRFPIEEVERYPTPQEGKDASSFAGLRVVLRMADDQLVTLFNIHLPTARPALQELLDKPKSLCLSNSALLTANIEHRQAASAAAKQWVAQASGPVIVVGDFNMPTDSAIYREHWSGLSNAFSTSGLGIGYTRWAVWCGISFGVRIDHILTGPGWRCHTCWVGPDVGSDHLPVIADLRWVGTR